MGRSTSTQIANMYAAPAESAHSRTPPETADESVPEFAYDFVAAGVPFAPAVALARRIARTCQELRDHVIDEAEAERRIDRYAGLVFMAVASKAVAA